MITTKFYVKIHQITGHRYLGKTIRCPIKNGGNGIRYNNHAKKYGDLWDTYEIAEFPSDQKEKIRRFGLYLSAKHDIVDLDKWLNLIPENGLDGALTGEDNHMKRPEIAAKVSEALKGVPKSEEHKRKQSENKMGHETSDETKRKISETLLGYGKDYIITDLKGREHFVRSPTEFAKRYFPDNWKNVVVCILETAAGRQKTFCGGWTSEIAKGI